MYTLNCKGKLLVLDKPVVMGIINATPDSFYEGHLQKGLQHIENLAGTMLADGAAILDIGGQSTRPGSERTAAAEELKRVVPVIETIVQKYPAAIISVDTYYAETAAAAVHAGASMINDISAGSMDTNMIATAASLQVPYVCMHMQGTPATMQQHPHYENVVQEVLDFFIQKIKQCKDAGIHDMVIDPGFGFGKNMQHNFQLLKNLSLFGMLEKPVLAGISRKGMVYKTLGSTPAAALNGSTVLHTMALMNGANILRVHEVKEAVEAIKLYEAYSNC